MKHYSLLLICILAHLLNYGQTKPIQKRNYDIQTLDKIGDSLIKAKKYNETLSIYKHNLNIRLDENNKIQTHHILNKIGRLYYYKKDYINADINYKRALKIDSTSSLSAELFYNIFLVKRKRNQPDSVLYYLEKSLSQYKTRSEIYEANNVFLTAGIVYKNRQEFVKALHYLVLAYQGFTNLKNDKKLSDVCVTIGNVHNALKNHNQALEYHYEALRLQKKINNKRGIARFYNNLANVYDNLELIDSAVTNYKRAIRYSKTNTSQYGKSLSNLANTYLKLNKIALAKTNYRKAIKTNIFLKDTTSLLYNYNGILSLELKENNLKMSRFYLDTIGNLIKKNSDNIINLNYYENKVEFFRKTQDYKTALGYQVEYSDLYETIYNKEQMELVNNIQSKFDTKNKENKIQSLNLANQKKEVQLQKTYKSLSNKNTALIILSFAIFMAIIGFYTYLQQQKLKAQSVKHEKLKAIYTGQETIKKRIARDLHDIITTNFDGLRLKILALKKSTNPEKLIEDTTSQLKHINRQIRVVSHRLSPLEMQMSHQKFTNVIKSRLSEFHLYGKVFVELNELLPEVLNSLEITIQNNFYGILLEILNNIEKHSHATKLNIHHSIDKDKRLNFIFTDNGIGIGTHFIEGIGLLNIRQRCEIINGTCTISKVDSGTQVTISFPIKN